MTIVGYDLSTIDLRLTEEVATAVGPVGDRSALTLTLRTDSGVVGLGEASSVPGQPTVDLDERAGVLRAWAEGVTGLSLDDARASLADAALEPVARFAVSSALLDAQARVADVPLAQYLRAGSPGVVRVNGLVAAPDPAGVAAAVSALRAAGMPANKLKVARDDPAVDARRIIAASEAAGAGIELRLDANRGWTTATAVHVIGRVGPRRIGYIEDPTPDIAEYGAITRETGVAVGLDVGVGESADPLTALERSGAAVLVVKAAAVGGIDIVMDLARRLDPDRRLVVTSSIDGPVALLAAAHVAAAVPGDEAHGLGTGPLVSAVPESLYPREGVVALPTGSGLGEP